MKVNGYNNYKVDTLGSDQGPGNSNGVDPKADDVSSTFDEIFGTAGQSASQNSSIFGESDAVSTYFVGPNAEGTSATNFYKNSPPKFEDVMTNNMKLRYHMDIFIAKYQKFGSDVDALISQLEIAKNQCTTPDQAKTVVDKINALVACKARTKVETEKAIAFKNNQDITWSQEEINFVDQDGDGLISNKYYIKYDANGKKQVYDLETKQRISTPVLNRDYKAKVFDDGNLDLIDDPKQSWDYEAHGGKVPDKGADVYLKIKENWKPAGPYQTAFDFRPPACVWCTEDQDGNLKMWNHFEASADGIIQATPTDSTGKKQIKVDECLLSSQLAGYVDGDTTKPIYNTIVTLKYQGEVLGTFQIEGYKVDVQNGTDGPPMATRIGAGGDYFAMTSTLGLSVGPSLGPIKLDMSLLQSTGMHLFDPTKGFADPYNEGQTKYVSDGIQKPGDDPARPSNLELPTGGQDNVHAKYAYSENMGHFTSEVYEFDQTDGKGDWQGPNSYDFSKTGIDANNNPTSIDFGVGKTYQDRYVPPELKTIDSKTNKEVTLSGKAYTNCAYTWGVRGHIIGSDFNDYIQTAAPDEIPLDLKEYFPDDLATPKSTDAMYYNFVEGGGGTNAWIGGKGNNVVSDVQFAKVIGASQDDENLISFQNIFKSGGNNGTANCSKNQRNYLDIDGGHAKVFIPDEYNPSFHVVDPQNPDLANVRKNAYLDDFYKIAGADVQFSNPSDYDVQYCTGVSNDGGDGFDMTQVSQWKKMYYEDWEKEWKNDYADDGSAEDVLTEDEIKNVIGGTAEEDATMLDQFFGDVSQVTGEDQQFQQEAAASTPESPAT